MALQRRLRSPHRVRKPSRGLLRRQDLSRIVRQRAQFRQEPLRRDAIGGRFRHRSAFRAHARARMWCTNSSGVTPVVWRDRTPLAPPSRVIAIARVRDGCGGVARGALRFARLWRYLQTQCVANAGRVGLRFRGSISSDVVTRRLDKDLRRENNPELIARNLRPECLSADQPNPAWRDPIHGRVRAGEPA